MATLIRNGKVWSSNRCLGNCTVQYGGQYKTTHGFGQAECSSNIQSSNKIGFWCDWDGGDGSVMISGDLQPSPTHYTCGSVDSKLALQIQTHLAPF